MANNSDLDLVIVGGGIGGDAKERRGGGTTVSVGQ